MDAKQRLQPATPQELRAALQPLSAVNAALLPTTMQPALVSVDWRDRTHDDGALMRLESGGVGAGGSAAAGYSASASYFVSS